MRRDSNQTACKKRMKANTRKRSRSIRFTTLTRKRLG